MHTGVPPEEFRRDAARVAQERGVSEIDSVFLCMLASLQVAEEEGMNPSARAARGGVPRPNQRCNAKPVWMTAGMCTPEGLWPAGIMLLRRRRARASGPRDRSEMELPEIEDRESLGRGGRQELAIRGHQDAGAVGDSVEEEGTGEMDGVEAAEPVPTHQLGGRVHDAPASRISYAGVVPVKSESSERRRISASGAESFLSLRRRVKADVVSG